MDRRDRDAVTQLSPCTATSRSLAGINAQFARSTAGTATVQHACPVSRGYRSDRAWSWSAAAVRSGPVRPRLPQTTQHRPHDAAVQPTTADTRSRVKEHLRATSGSSSSGRRGTHAFDRDRKPATSVHRSVAGLGDALTMLCLSLTRGWPTEVGSTQCSALWHHQAPAFLCACPRTGASRSKTVLPPAL